MKVVSVVYSSCRHISDTDALPDIGTASSDGVLSSSS